MAHTIDEWSLVRILFDDLLYNFKFRLSRSVPFYLAIKRKNMERLEQDLRYFMYKLKRENNRLPRNLLLREVAHVQQQILDLMREKQERMEWETRNMSALDIIRRPEKKK